MIPGRNDTHQMLDALRLADRVKFRNERRIRRQLHSVDPGNHPHGIAQGRRIHIVLHAGQRHDDVPDMQVFRERPAHARIDEHRRAELHDHRLGAHRGEHLADAALRKHHILSHERAAHKIDAAHAFRHGVFHFGLEKRHFHFHRADDAYHVLFLIFEVRVDEIFKNREVATTLRFCRFNREATVITAFSGRRPEHRPLVRKGLSEAILQDGQHFLIIGVSHQKIESRLAAHGTEINDVGRHLGITNERRDHVFDGMHRDDVHVVPGVGLTGTEVIGRDVAVDARHINPRFQHIVIDAEALNFFHDRNGADRDARFDFE